VQALRLALASDCFYVGALGSRATHARRIGRLTAEGVGPGALARLRAPIGLDIGALSPAEIAVSTLAEIILARGRKPLRQPRPADVSAAAE
jgi:xanthine dehydrogenase accessory factor